MKTICDGTGLLGADRGAVVAIGDFDGVHTGHAQMIAEAAEMARALDAPLAVVCRTGGGGGPPRAIPPERLTNPSQLARRLEGLGVDILYHLDSESAAAPLAERAFVRRVLVEGLGARRLTLAVDDDGELDALRRWGEVFDFTVSVSDAARPHGGAVASDTAREALKTGRPEQAAAMLGRPFAIEGIVQHGRKLGRTLGFPTANVALGDYVTPKFGVYATLTRFKDGRQVPGVAHIGVNPTTGLVAPVLEVWLFDFAEEIYGETIETDLIGFQRPQEKFANLEAMVEQVRRDAIEARRLLAAAP